MSVFLAFRTAAAAVLHPTRRQRLIQDPFPLLFRSLKTTRSHPKNGQIPFDVVQLQDENGTLHHAQNLTKILESVDTSTHVVRLISQQPPIVQIVSQMEDKIRKLEMKAKRKAHESRRNILNKETQMSWFTAGQDFDHKVAKVHEDLEKGDVRIDVVFNPKAKVRNPTRDEMLEQLDEVARRVSDVGTEWRERDFRRGSARMSLQSIVKKEKLLPTEAEVKELAKEEVKRLERQALRRRQNTERKKDIVPDA